MTAGVSSILQSLSRQRTVIGRFTHEQVTLGHHRQLPAMSMFKRANATYEAKNKTQPQAPGPLAKQLFPSSSPSPLHDGNIKEQFQKRVGSSLVSSNPNQFSKPAAPLQPRSSNPPQSVRPQQTTRAVNSKPLASLYNSQNSFKDEPEVIDLTDDGVQATKRGKTAVDFNEDDFSDDGSLDLDYEAPTALPPPPAQRTPAKTYNVAPPVSDASFMSWSQSSPSHLQAAQSVSQLMVPQKSTKRSSPEDDVPALPMAKKRSLPIQYLHYKQSEEGYASPSETLAETPAPKTKSKPKGPLTWDLTPGAVKTKQKNLKDRSKKPAISSNEPSAEEMQHAITSHKPKQTAISLSKEQTWVKDLVCDKGDSVFFTGPAGTGKSVLMRAMITDLKKKFAKEPERLAVTASTGLAACNIGGMTLHSFAGIGLGKDDAPTLVKKIRRNPKAKNRWLKTKVLIIDEISMVDGELFDKLSYIGRTLRNHGKPWGGIQLVITGDFLQLPPVPDRGSRDVKFAFEASTWNTSIDHVIGLTEVFRQKDPVFAEMLNEMRLGRISDQTVAAFKGLSRTPHFEDSLEVTELFPTRQEVDNSNQRRLRDLPGEIQTYGAFDGGDPAIRDKLLGNMMAPKVLDLKKGAQVMLIKNLDETLVNGSLGTVIGFSTESAFEIGGGVFDDEDGVGNGEVDPMVKRRFAAFSRDLNSNAVPDKKKYPLVQFHAVDGSARIMLCVPEEWKVETPTGEVQASRSQLPLILAWALSIHKAQGQTLARVKVDLGRVFEKGQAYVALSRAVTQEGLQVLRFDKQKVMAHPRVVSFYRNLDSAEAIVKKQTERPNASITSFAYKSAGAFVTRKPVDVVDLEDEEEAMASYGY